MLSLKIKILVADRQIFRKNIFTRARVNQINYGQDEYLKEKCYFCIINDIGQSTRTTAQYFTINEHLWNGLK